MDLELEMLERIQAGKKQHDRECDDPCHAILLNPGNWRLIGWDEVLGLPVLPDPRVEPKRFEVVCGISLGGWLGQRPVVWTRAGHPRVLMSGRREKTRED